MYKVDDCIIYLKENILYFSTDILNLDYMTLHFFLNATIIKQQISDIVYISYERPKEEKIHQGLYECFWEPNHSIARIEDKEEDYICIIDKHGKEIYYGIIA